MGRPAAGDGDRRRTFLLKTEMAAGHGGRSGRYDAWREEALTLAWIVTTAKGPEAADAGESGGDGTEAGLSA